MAGGKKLKQQRESLARFLAYVLGHRPDEFGLAPDEEGFVPLKELLWALGEEEGWRYVREGHIKELLREPGRSGLDVREKLIRAAPEKSMLEAGPPPSAVPPKQLYHAARRKAYPHIRKNGLTPTGGRPFVPLFPDKAMALRVGRRRDPDPVLVTVQAERADERGVTFHRQGELIYLAQSIAPDLIIGPPLPKEKEEPDKKKRAAPPAAPPHSSPHPGSFYLEAEKIWDPGTTPVKGKKKKKGDAPDWKRASRKERRRKR